MKSSTWSRPAQGCASTKRPPLGTVRAPRKLWPTTTSATTRAEPITIRVTGDTDTGRLLGAQLVGRLGTETAKRVDTYATALFAGLTVDQVSDLDLSYTPPLGSPWDAVKTATQTWTRQYTKT